MLHEPVGARSICIAVVACLLMAMASADETRPAAHHQDHHKHESKHMDRAHHHREHAHHKGQHAQHHGEHAHHKHHGEHAHHHEPHGKKHHESKSAHHQKSHSASYDKKESQLANTKSTHHTLQESCEKLINHGTHFTVELEVGTPAQKFAVVADTGSDAILIPSCQCVEDMYCSNESRCFMGTGKSKTFSYKKNKKGDPLNSVKMMFGSGPVEAVVASDSVRVGNVQVMMKDAVLLMTDHMLNIKGPFEGILGLGLPASSVKNGLYRKSTEQSSKDGSLKSGGSGSGGSHKDAKYTQSLDKPLVSHHQRHVKGNGPVVDYSPMMNIALPDRVFQVEPSASLLQVTKPMHKKAHLTAGAQEDSLPIHPVEFNTSGTTRVKKGNNSAGIVVKGFAENAGIDRFSMCFNDGAPGVLRLQSEKVELSHGSVGQVHWGLDFRGITVGKQNLSVNICTKTTEPNQTTPCGAIPDSGTTALMGPKEHILALYESICDGWDRCKSNHTAFLKAREMAHKAAIKYYGVDPFELQNATKGMIFQMLLMDCHTWWVNGTGLDELPDLQFHIRGEKGTKQNLKLHGWSYVIETYEKDFTTIYKDIEGVGTMPVGRNFTGGSHKVCSPAFSTMDYQTEKNGPVWILGTPIFYEYQVGYDYKASPPSMSFDDTECGTCDMHKKTSLTAVDSKRGRPAEGLLASSSALGRGRRPRQVLGKFRMPNIDVTLPL